MRRAGQVATIGFAALIVFQAALAAGVPLGEAAWGGDHTHLTTGQRAGSAASILVYVLAILVVRGRAAGHEERRYRWGVWALAVLFGMSALTNAASESRWENFVLAPMAMALAALCMVVARSAGRAPTRRTFVRPAR